MNRWKTYTFGAPVHSWSSATASGAVTTNTSVPDWNLTAITLSSTSKTAAPEERLMHEVQEEVALYVKKVKPVGIFCEQPPKEAQRKKFRIQLSDTVFNSKNQSDLILVNWLRRAVIEHLENLRDAENVDIYLSSFQMNANNPQNIGVEVLVEIFVLGDITDKHDIYLDPATGEIKFENA